MWLARIRTAFGGRSKQKLGCILLAAASGGLWACGPSAEESPEGFFARFVSPESGAVLGGEVPFEVEVNAPPDLLSVTLGLEGEAAQPLRGGGSTIVIPTLNHPDGDHTWVLRMESESGGVWEDRLSASVDNPEHRLTELYVPELEYGNGGEIVFDVRYTQAGLQLEADFAAIDTGFDPARVAVEDLGEGAYRLRYTLSPDNRAPDGLHAVTLAALDASGGEVSNTVELRLQNQPEIPIVVAGATFVEGPPPELSDPSGNAPQITAIESASGNTLLRGGTLELEITWAQDPAQPADKLALKLDGFDGYYLVPLPPPAAPAEEGRVLVLLSLPASAPGFDDGPLGLGAGILDVFGQAVDWVSETITGISVGSDGVQVGLTWDAPVDLDLAVTDPMGRLIDFEQPSQGTGSLDLDSNSLCQIDGTNAERISWQPGGELQGIYQVRVNLYDACGDDFVQWRVTAEFCGRTEVFTGTFVAADVDMSGTGQVVTEFTVNCNQVVRGTVIREKLNRVDQPGIRELAVVPRAPIRIKSADGITTLAQGITDERGRYDLRFGNLDQQDFYLEVEASWVDPTTNEVRARVAPIDGGTAHRFQTEVLAGADALVREVNPRIKVESNAGAFNVLDAIRRGYAWVNAHAPAAKAESLSEMTGRFTDGGATANGNSYQLGEELFINGTAAIPHQWSDSVNMHEFMHFVVRNVSFSPLPGGPHGFESKSDPHLSWSEGLATVFAHDALGKSLYEDRRPAQVYQYDLEVGKPVLNGTSDNTTKGNVNEFLVSIVIWDLLDAAGNEPHDHILERQFTFSTTFERTPADRNGNRLDLGDFLDQLRSDFPGNADSRLKCITDAVDYRYDYPASVACGP